MPTKKTITAIAPVAAIAKPKTAARRSRGHRAKLSKETYGTYTRLVLKQVHPNLCMTSAAADVFNNMSNHVIDTLLEQSCNLCKMATRGGQTLSARHVELAVKKCFPDDLAKHALMEMRKANTKLRAA